MDFHASSLILFGKIRQIHLVEALSPGFRIPRPVVAEIGAGPPDDRTIEWLRQKSINNHIVESPPVPPFLAQWDLGSCETAVPALALIDKVSVVVLDDLAARKFALNFDLPLLGPLRLLVGAKNAGFVENVTPHIQSLISAGADLSSSVVRRALQLANEEP